MKITNTEFVSSRISKDFTIELKNGEEIIVNKWAFQSNDGSDDYDNEIIEGKEFYEKMSEEEQDEFNDFVDINCKL